MGEYKCIYSVGSVKTDYIPREAVRDLMYHKQSPLTEYDLDEIEAADVVPVVHGWWETDKEDIEWGNSLKRKHCTNCGKRPHYDKEKKEFVLSNYCPNCGVKMDGEQ